MSLPQDLEKGTLAEEEHEQEHEIGTKTESTAYQSDNSRNPSPKNDGSANASIADRDSNLEAVKTMDEGHIDDLERQKVRNNHSHCAFSKYPLTFLSHLDNHRINKSRTILPPRTSKFRLERQNQHEFEILQRFQTRPHSPSISYSARQTSTASYSSLQPRKRYCRMGKPDRSRNASEFPGNEEMGADGFTG